MQSARSALIAAGLTALSFGLLNAPQSFTLLAPIALLPVCCALEKGGACRGAAVGFTFGFTTTFFIISWLVPTAQDYFGRSWPTAVVFTALVSALSIAPYFAIAFALYAFARPRVPAGLRPWLFGAAWVSAEIARSQLGLRSTWSLLGTSLADVAALRQGAAIAGVYGLSFGLAVVNAVLWRWLDVGLFSRPRLPALNRRRLEWPIASTALLAIGIAALAVWGRWRIEAASTRPPSGLRVALVQGSVPEDQLQPRSKQRQLIAYYTRLSRKALSTEPPPELIVWPENALESGAEDPIFGQPLQTLVERLGVPVLIGAPRVTRGARYNSASLLRPGEPPLHYDKLRLLPFSETHPIDGLPSLRRENGRASGYTPGERLGLVPWRGRWLGLTICVEGVFPDLARSLARRGADALVNLSRDDWFRGRGGPAQHFAQVRLRAVETGLPLLRTTAAGLTAIVSPEGEIAASLPPGQDGVLVAELPARLSGTFYVAAGEWLPAGCLAFLMGAVACRAVGLLGRLRGLHVPHPG